MTSVGETLRRERLRQGFELNQISRELKIAPRYLEAIEDDDFKKLPGGVFAKSFVRQYARLLSLEEEEELASEVQRLIEPETLGPPIVAQPRATRAEFHLPQVSSWSGAVGRRSPLAALGMVVVAMLACSVVYNWWQRKVQQVSAHQQTASVTQPAQPAATITPPVPAQQTPAPAAAEPSSAPAVQPPPVSAAEPNSADRPAVDPVPPPTAQPAGAPPAAAPPVPAPAVPAPAVDAATANWAAQQPAKGAVRLELTASVPVWVLAQSNGKYLFSGTIDTNQTRTVEADGPIVLRLGNAGALQFTLNGKPVGAVGSKGQVVTVQFTSGGFHIVAAPKPASFDPIGAL